DELHRARPPGPARLDPGAGPAVVVGLEVLEGLEAALTLSEAESACGRLGKTADLHGTGIAKRAPLAPTLGPGQQQAVRIVHLRAKVVEGVRFARAVKEHAGQRCRAEERRVGAGGRG